MYGSELDKNHVVVVAPDQGKQHIEISSRTEMKDPLLRNRPRHKPRLGKTLAVRRDNVQKHIGLATSSIRSWNLLVF